MQHQGLILTTAPAIEPITLADAKNFLRVDITDDDTLIRALISGARAACENYTKRAFITQTYDLWLDLVGHPQQKWWDGVQDGSLNMLYFSPSKIQIPRPPFQSLVSITTYDLSDTPALYDLSNIIVDVASVPGRIALKYGRVWPAALRMVNCMDIQFKAGYSDDASNIPYDILQAMRITIAHMYEHRTPFELGRAAEVPMSAQFLLNPFRVLKL